MSSTGRFGLFPDTDTNIIYSGNWTAEPNPDPENVSSMNTVHVTDTPQSNLSFIFTGVTFTAQATIPVGSGSVNVEFSVDGGPFTPVSVPSGQQATVDTSFISATLSTMGPHNVVIVYTGDSMNTSFLFGGLFLASNNVTSPVSLNRDLVVPPAQVAPSFTSPAPSSSFTISNVSPTLQSSRFTSAPVDSQTSPVATSTEASIQPSGPLAVTIPTVTFPVERTGGVPTNNPSETSELPAEISSTVTFTPIISGTDSSSSVPLVLQTETPSAEKSGTTSTVGPALAKTSQLFISASTNTAANTRLGTAFSTSLPTGNNPPFISSGSPNAGKASSRQNIHVIQGAVSGSALLFAAILIAMVWFYRKRRLSSRFWARLDDEGSLLPRDSRSTLVSTTPRPFILARIWSAIATAPRKLTGGDNVSQTGGEPEFRVISSDQGLVSHTNGRSDIEGAMTRSRTSSVTTTTLVPQYESRSSWPSQDFSLREQSISDAPPTYHSDRDSNFSVDIL